MSPEEMQKGKETWMAWMSDNSASFVDEGAPVGKNLRVTKDSAEHNSNEIGGYAIMQADSEEALTEVLQKSPHFEIPGVYVEVMPLVEM